MMPRGRSLVWVAALVGCVTGAVAFGGEAAAGEPPKIVSTSPAVGARDVDPATAEITVTFDRDMAKGFSWTGGGTNHPPGVEGRGAFWRDARTAVRPVSLEPGRYYRVGINSKSHRNFRSAAGVPAQPSAIYFTTRGASEELIAKTQKPVVLEMRPANGATEVDPKTTELRVTFSVPMSGGFSWTGGGPDYPALREGEGPRWAEDGRTCVLPVRLEPGRQYRLGLNSPSHKNFQSADGVPLDPVAYTFRTVGYAGKTSQPSKLFLSTDRIPQPIHRFPDVSGVVIDGAMDTSPSKLETVVRFLAAQQEAAKAGDMARYHELERQGTSNLLNVVAPSRPLPHATVSLFAHDASPHSGALQTATADAEGKFEFFDVPRGLYRVVAQDVRKGTNGCPAAEMTMEHYRTSCAHVRLVVYPQTVTLTGRVTDSAGHPLTNVTVSAQQGHERFVETEGDFTRFYHEAAAQTDSDGRYELKGLIPAGVCYGGANAWYTLKVSAPGYASAKAFVPVAPEEVRQAAHRFTEMLMQEASPHQRAGWRKPEPVEQPPCQGHRLTGVDFALYKSVRIEGAFVDKDGGPPQGCTVLFSLTNHAESCSYQAFTEGSLRAQCDAEGRFRFDGVAPGTYKVQVYKKERLVSGKAPLVVTVRENEPLSGLRLVNDVLPGGSIKGIVTDAASGKPVKGVTIYSVHKETGATTCMPFLCLCGKSGYHTAECERWAERVIQTNDLRVSTFIAEKVSSGKSELVVKAPGYAEERVLVEITPDGMSKQEIKLWRSGTARIRPVIKAGARVDQYASVPNNPPLVHYVAVPAQGGRCIRGGRPSKQFGYDEFADLKPGQYTLRGDISYLPGPVTRYETVPVEIISAQTNEVELAFDGACGIKLALAFSPGTAIWARLETADTTPSQDLERNLGLRASVFVKEPGTVLIPDLKPGTYRLSLFRRKVPADKGQKERTEPDQVKVLTLEEGNTIQTHSFRF